MTDFFAKDQNTPDLSTVSVMFCTPSNDGKYEKSYMGSLFNTFKEIDRLGGKARLAEFPYCSDIALARAKLLGSFYRSSCTHLMFVDADMGWNAKDVIRLILFQRDFVAAAGPKKKYPLEFAANMTDDAGMKLPVLQEGTGLIEVNEVGGAFVLLSRACVERVWQAHPELEFNGDNYTKERALFDPIVVNGRRLSEDYGYCRRWKNLGGKIYILPDVTLSHTGSHTFTGALEDTFADNFRVEELRAPIPNINRVVAELDHIASKLDIKSYDVGKANGTRA